MASSPMAEINLQDLVRRRGRIQAVGLARMPAEYVRGLYESMRSEFSTAALRPVISRSFPLDEAAEAQRYLDQDRPFGKVLLQIAAQA